MAMDLDAFLAPLEGEAPAGPDLTYSPERQQIEEAFAEADAEADVTYVNGELVAREGAAGMGPDWRKTTALILKECKRSRDLWLGIYLVRAAARAGDLQTVLDGLMLSQGMLEQWWDTGWPSLEEDGPIARRTAVGSLAQPNGFMKPFMGVVLMTHPRHGPFTAGDFSRFAADTGASEEGFGLFRAAIEDADAEEMASVRARLVAVHDVLGSVEKALDDRMDGQGVRLIEPRQMVEGVIRALATFVDDGPAVDLVEEAVGDADAPNGSAGPRGPSAPGVISSRQDVTRALDAICDFYKRSEPGSPVPLILNRARRWVDLDFMGILSDIAPSGTNEAKNILSSREEN